MRVINEHSGNEFTAWFESVPGVPTVPSTVDWRLRNLTADKTVQDWSSITAEIVADETGITGVKATVEVPGSLNVLDDPSARRETFELMVVSDKDTSREFSETFEYAVAYKGKR